MGREMCERCVETGVTPHPVTGALGGAPHWATQRVRGAPTRASRHHANPATRAFNGAPYGHEASEGCAFLGVTPPCEPCRWGLMWSSLRGHDTYEGCAGMVDMWRAEAGMGERRGRRKDE